MCDTNFELSEYVQRLPFLPNPSSAYECLYLGVSVWCLGVSGWCVRVSGDVSNQIYWENVILGHYTQILPFLPMPCICVKKAMSGGVWMVSVCVWWCVRVSGESPSGDVSIPNPLAKCYIRSLCSDIAFSPSAL